ncbi:hypothetical protein [Marinobacter sp. CHS3-4]|uniref:hypothetical protein n=1 Tax=Marinobacter sp. CHS3-4 TaxID=3045174 RepID=UPI0024B48AA8|nr:hypothetical protein [Marinobacter sp. CHS3-4]MDI9245075.1 hypothetical protein [Marinobacter sp. CHS3-4]
MYKKTLLSLAVASSITLTGCIGTESGDDEKPVNPNATSAINPAGSVWPIFDPATSALPVPSDLQAAGSSDGTYGGSDENPITNALDFMDGASTTAQYDIKLSGTIDPDSLVFTPVIDNDGTPAPNPQQNVFLLSLDYPGGDGLLNSGEVPTFDIGLAFQNLQAKAAAFEAEQNAETPDPDAIAAAGAELQAAAAAVQDFNNEFRAEVVDLDGGTDNVLRITPLRPLKPKTKYLVVITNEVTEPNGDPIFPSPSYQFTRDPDKVLLDPALGGVRDAIAGWEQLASGYFAALTNSSREAIPSLDPLTSDNIALSLTFTTGGTTDVLEAAVSPAQFFYRSSVIDTRQTAIADYLAANSETFAALSAPEQWATLNQVANDAVDDANEAPPTLAQTAAGTVAALADIGAEFSIPAARTILPFEATRIPPGANPALPNDESTILQASIELPYFLEVPSTEPAEAESAAQALNSTWEASTGIGAAIDAASGNDSGTTPPSDKITYRYPFATEKATVTAPLMFSVPDPSTVIDIDGTTCGDTKPYDVVIYQHGIFGNRANSLPMANQLARACYVTVAMDLPLHGIAPKLADGRDDPFLFFSVDNGVFSGVPVSERHFGWSQGADGPTRMVYGDGALGSSAEYFLNLGNLPAARDNNRQGVVDLLNLNASLINLNDIDLDNDGTANDVALDFDTETGSNLYYVGHSLGGILGTSFVALVNDAAQDDVLGNSNIIPINAAALVTPGAGIAKLLENSPSIGSTVLQGLAQSGLTQGTSNLELYLNVAQASLDSAEPHNFVSSLNESGTKVYINEIFGDGSDPTTADQTIPIAADTAYAGQYSAPLGEALPAPLAGTEPLIAQLEADRVDVAIAPAGESLTQDANVVRFTAGTHSTVVSADNTAVFADMATNIISFFGSNGTSLSFNNGASVKADSPSAD